MVPERFEKQVAFMEENKDVAGCSGWQQYVGLSTPFCMLRRKTPSDAKLIAYFVVIYVIRL